MISGLAHVGLSVSKLEKTIEFYSGVLGLEFVSRTRVKGDSLGVGLFGTKWGISQRHGDLEVAILKVGGVNIEFIEYKDPEAQPYHKNPSVAGSAHLAFMVEDIEKTRTELEKAGVEFHSQTNRIEQDGKVAWKWCYFRDPDGMVLELVEKVK